MAIEKARFPAGYLVYACMHAGRDRFPDDRIDEVRGDLARVLARPARAPPLTR